jgi:alpha-L-fucosidase
MRVLGGCGLALTTLVAAEKVKTGGGRTINGDVQIEVAKAAQQYARSAGTPEREERIGWYRDAGFGIFVHWGVYAHLGGEWQGNDYGKEMGGASAEWIRYTAKISAQDYAKLAAEWNPHAYDPDAWCAAAAAAGARYIVLTAKHHDGFALFDDGDATSWDIVEHNPHADDLIKPYVAAARKHGLKVGFYYSHKKDWQHDPDEKPHQNQAYLAILKQHLTTLMAHQPDLIWFDNNGTTVAEYCHDIVRALKGDVVLGGRIGGGYGDYACMGDRGVPPPGLHVDGESPMTSRLNWGYDRDDEAWKEPDELVRMLSACVTRNCNLLLNQGPHPDGSWLPQELERLRYIGAWMESRSVAIHNSRGTPFYGEFPWGSISRSADDRHVYLHVHAWPADGIVRVPGVSADAVTAQVLGHDHLAAAVSTDDKGLVIMVAGLTDPGAVEIVALRCPDGARYDLAGGPQRGAAMSVPLHSELEIRFSGAVSAISDEGMEVTKDNGVVMHVFGWQAPNHGPHGITRADGSAGSRADLALGQRVTVRRGYVRSWNMKKGYAKPKSGTTAWADITIRE